MKPSDASSESTEVVVIGKRSWMVAAVVATGVAVVSGGVSMVSAATRTGCDVAYTVSSQRNTGFNVNLRVRNTGTTAVKGWTLRWTFPGNQRVVRGWNGSFTQRGSSVTVKAADRSRRIAPNAETQLGFFGSDSGSNQPPTTFNLNGVTCSVNGGPTPAPTFGTPGPTSPGPTSPGPTSTATGAPTQTGTSEPTQTQIQNPPSAPTPTTDASDSPPPTDASGQALGAGRIQYGPTYTGEGTHYGATGEGNCSYEASTDRMIAAMNETDYQNSQACGAYLAVTGPSGTTINVKIVDRCPECKPGDIDLSIEAFTKLAPIKTGRMKISWKLLSPTMSAPILFRYKDGSSTSWCGVQVRNHRNPIRSVEALVFNAWQSLPRQMYNYFVSEKGSGCGSTLRVTDIYGHQLVDSTIVINPDPKKYLNGIQPGKAQFGPPS
jgi:expansin (peptidoglycan-binding protein)